MKTTTLLIILVLGILVAPLAAEAQPAGKIPRIGVLYPGVRPVKPGGGGGARFFQALRELGYVEGQTIALEGRWAENQPERYPALAAELVRLPVDIIVAGDTAAAVAAKHATSTIPIVAVMFDAVRDGLVASLARPGGNITGLSAMVPEVSGKRLELLTEAVPGLSHVALLLDAGPPNWHAQLPDYEAAARGLGVQLFPLEVRGPDEFAGAYQAATQGHAQALIMVQSPLFSTYRAQLAALALASRLPTRAGRCWR
jgi:putative ABC transport system substrate-binding protein